MEFQSSDFCLPRTAFFLSVNSLLWAAHRTVVFMFVCLFSVSSEGGTRITTPSPTPRDWGRLAGRGFLPQPSLAAANLSIWSPYALTTRPHYLRYCRLPFFLPPELCPVNYYDRTAWRVPSQTGGTLSLLGCVIATWCHSQLQKENQ